VEEVGGFELRLHALYDFAVGQRAGTRVAPPLITQTLLHMSFKIRRSIGRARDSRAEWWRRAPALMSVCLLFAAAICAQPTEPPAALSVQQPSPPDDADAALGRAAAATATVDAPPAPLTFQNREIVWFRATVLSRTPAMRAASVARVLDDLADLPTAGAVTTRPFEDGQLVSVGAVDVFALVPADLDPLSGETLEDTARAAAARLRLALQEAIELRTPTRLLQSALWALLATVALVVLLRLLVRGHHWITVRSTRAADRQLQRLPGAEVMRASRLLELLRHVVTLVSVGVALALAYSWLTFVLRRFPYTRPWGEALRGFLLERIVALGLGMIHALPDLFSVALIVVITRFAVKLSGLLFEAIERGRASLPWVYPETAQPTRRLVACFLWLFALALAYPYLPGSETDAFKGVSVFVGLMISLGSSGIVNQVMSGLTLTYSRALRKGDFVRIGDIEGTVTHLGSLSTKLKTPRREEVTIPNTVVVSAQTTNYSRLADSEGVFAATSLTIGYDVPWRQVKALLLLAAERTAGIRREPESAVRQTALRDFYVEYTLLICIQDSASRAPTLDRLHANIQDAFNEHGVQIMSPNYEADPAGPKIVPRERWHAAPACEPQSSDD
jgi:small-conductance mechanosensitive channel